MVKCDICGGTFKTKSGALSHARAKHADVVDAEHRLLDEAGDEVMESRLLNIGSEPGDRELTEPKPPEAKPRPAKAVRAKDPLSVACRALGIKKGNVMAHKVYEHKVVIIEGPIGKKRVHKRGS